MVTMLDTAYAYLAAGRSIIPIAPGCKRPSVISEWGEIQDVSWAAYQHIRPSAAVVKKWFDTSTPMGIGIVGGSVSGKSLVIIYGLEFLDIDDPDTVPLFLEQANYLGLSQILKQLPFERTPKGGAHIGYLCSAWEGNQVLAQKVIDGKSVTTIETRGSGGLCVVAPTPSGIHPNHPDKGYVLERGSWTDIPTITKEERALLFDIARGMTETVSTAPKPKPVVTGNRPGDKLNATADSAWWEQLLTKHGWKRLHEKGGVEYWQRPGKEGKEGSATLGKCGQYFYVFSSNAAPFEANRAYSPFAALTLLEHHNNYTEAAQALGGESMAESKNVGALWVRTAKDGRKFMSGVIKLGLLGDINIIVFENTQIEKDTQPNFNILLSQPTPEAAPAQKVSAFDLLNGSEPDDVPDPRR